MQSDIESALIGISHLAERLGLSRRTIHRILSRGELPSLQIGRRRLIRLFDSRAWVSGATDATAQHERYKSQSPIPLSEPRCGEPHGDNFAHTHFFCTNP